MEHQWILVRAHQAGLLAEAEQERLARHAREADERSESSMRASAIVHPAVRTAGRWLAAIGSTLAGDSALGPCDCPEA